ncbi:HNH endonuclease signature motif containing protein [Flavobacterium sp. ASV13]|uniref:HNH endonuclease n=1 Tax=Flavobacterium sp. ASV13 TaxID=1506583 RepID=UPI00068C7EBE
MARSAKKVNRSWVRPSVAFGREDKDDEFYNSRRWRNFRKSYLERNPLCVHCERDGYVTAATVADHKVRMKAGGEAFEESNIQALCEKCHNRKSAAESRGMG